MRGRSALFPIAMLVALQARAVADSFVEVAGGIMIPVEDDQWTNYVESGPKLAARVGGVGESHLGGMLSVDWSPLNTDNMGFGGLDVSAHRFRILASVMTQQRVAPKVFATLRLGGGLDITYTHVKLNAGPFSSDSTDTDSGLAIEAAGGVWVKAGSVMLGGELAFPLSFNSDGSGEDIDLADYTSFDVDVMFGVRISQK